MLRLHGGGGERLPILWFIKCGYQIFRMLVYHTYSEQNTSPHILILEICKCVTLHGKSEFKITDGIKVFN